MEGTMLELKVRKIGNSLGVVLPKEAVSRLQAGEGDRLFLIEGPEGAYQLTPYDPAFAKKMEQAENIIGRYRNTLDTLSQWLNLSGSTSANPPRYTIVFSPSME